MIDLDVLLKQIEQMFGIGCRMICEERLRQVQEEGFEPQKDQEHYANGELLGAAGCYLANYFNKDFHDSAEIEVARFEVRREHNGEDYFADGWPWNEEWDKREKHNKQRSAVIAGALVAAQIDLEKSEDNESDYLFTCESCEGKFDIKKMKSDSDSNWFCESCISELGPIMNEDTAKEAIEMLKRAESEYDVLQAKELFEKVDRLSLDDVLVDQWNEALGDAQKFLP